MKKLFITATNTDVGKTYTTLALLNQYAQMGYRVGAMKPIETGVLPSPPDAGKLLHLCQELNPDFAAITLEDICPLRFSLPAAPYVAADHKAFSLEIIYRKLDKLESRCDILLIEGAGGPMVPIHKDYFMIDLIADLQATPLLVTHDRLGCINDTLTHLALFRMRKFPLQWCVNLRDEVTFERLSAPFYRDYFGNFLTVQYDIASIAERLINT